MERHAAGRDVQGHPEKVAGVVLRLQLGQSLVVRSVARLDEFLFAALREDDEQTARFLGTVSGTVPTPDFYAPENIAAIVGSGNGR